MATTRDGKAPLAWILLGDKGGDNAQLRALAREAGLATVEIALRFNRRYRRSNMRLGASLQSLAAEARPLLRAPWPDIVFSSGRRAVPVARWIARQSGGRTRLVHLGRPWGRLKWFDLVVAPPQYGLPARANVFAARMPLNAPSAAALEDAAARWHQELSRYRRPWIGLLVGGDADPLVLDGATAAALGRTVQRRAQAQGGSVLALTSRRTGRAATQALFAALDAPGLRHAWRPDDADNPYLGVLALADEFVVTGDSASMLAEAVRRRRPVSIAPVPQRLRGARRRSAVLRRLLPRPLFDWLVERALITANRDLGRLHRRLIGDGLARMLEDALSPRRDLAGDLPLAADLADDLPLAAAAVRALLAPEPAPATSSSSRASPTPRPLAWSTPDAPRPAAATPR